MLFITIIIASALMSLIPAGVVKLLLPVFFGRSVSYLKVLGVMALSYVLLSMIVAILGYDTEAALDAMPDWLATGSSLATFALQAIVLWLVVNDEDGDVVPFLQWVIVLVLQYVVYLLLGLLMIFALA